MTAATLEGQDRMEPMKPLKPMEPMKPMEATKPWWPEKLGQPSSSGGQNGLRYAFFPKAHRLAVEKDGDVTLYDSGDHEIHGVSQSQGGEDSLTFSSQKGSVGLKDLKKASD